MSETLTSPHLPLKIKVKIFNQGGVVSNCTLCGLGKSVSQKRIPIIQFFLLTLNHKIISVLLGIELNNELKKGNPEAYKEFFQTVYPRLKGYCKLFILDQVQVEDIIQESFIALWEKRGDIQANKSVESLIFVIVRNRCLNYLKKIKLEEEKIEIENIQVLELQYLYQLDLLEKEGSSLEEMLIKSFQSEIDNLPDKMKKVFVSCKIEGRKQKDVANELGITLKMVEKHISKAKSQIRENLLKQYPALLALIAMMFD